jgi:endogenous inhibitor of DNA gyrase (YacG/DUF329 family)
MPRYRALDLAGAEVSLAFRARFARHCEVCGDETEWMDETYQVPSCSTECSDALLERETKQLQMMLPASNREDGS